VPGRTLGRVQDIEKVYPKITPHYHFEVLDRRGLVINLYLFLEDSIMSILKNVGVWVG
jgi:hypothetical protein